MNIVELLDKSKTKLGVNSDYALAKALEIHQARLSAYRKGVEHPDPYALVKIAMLLDLDPLALIAEAEEQSEKNPARKAFWGNFARRATSKLAVLALCCMALFGNEAAHSEKGAFFKRRYFA